MMGEIAKRTGGGGGGIKSFVLGEMYSGKENRFLYVAFPADWDWAYLAFAIGPIRGGKEYFVGKVDLKNDSGWIVVKFIKNNGFKYFNIVLNENLNGVKSFRFDAELTSGKTLSGYQSWDSFSFQM